MTSEPIDPVRQALSDHVRIWQCDPVGHAETLLRVAGETLSNMGAAGAGSWHGSLETLTVKGEHASRTRMAELVGALAEDLGLVPLTGVDVQDAGVEAYARRLLAREVTPRELTYWVTRAVGLRGGDRTTAFLRLEQEYCDQLGADVTDLDDRVREAAQLFVDPPDDSRSRRIGLLARWRRKQDRT